MGPIRYIFLLTAFIVCAGARAQVDRHSIRPGEGIGVINLGMTVKEVHDAMEAVRSEPLLKGKAGGPGAWMDKQAGCVIEAYQTDSLGHGTWGNVLKVYYVKDAVAQIATQSGAYVTNKGATTRLTSAEFRRLHPSINSMAERSSWSGRIRPYDSEAQGLAVTYAVIQRDSEIRTAQEIFVHKRGVPMMLESPRHEGKAPPPALDEQKKPSEDGSTGR